MTILDIDIGKDNREPREVIERRDFNLLDADRGSQAFVRLPDELLNDALLKEKHRSRRCNDNNQDCTGQIKQDLLQGLQ